MAPRRRNVDNSDTPTHLLKFKYARNRTDYKPPVHYNNGGKRFCRTTALDYINSSIKGEVTCTNCRRLFK